MARMSFGIVLVLAASTIAGCGGSDASQTPAATAGEQAEDTHGPDLAVFEFLSAVKNGDDEKTAALLTKLAREKTTALDMAVAPPGSDTASFEIGDVEFLPQDHAKVVCLWTDLDESGQPQTEEIVWNVRKEQGNWKVHGMGIQVGALLIDLNFEDPKDMLKKERMAQEELERQALSQQRIGVDETRR